MSGWRQSIAEYGGKSGNASHVLRWKMRKSMREGNSKNTKYFKNILRKLKLLILVL